MSMSHSVKWPEGKRFAFSVFDDTDAATLENVGGVYAHLQDCGFRTTKSCWVFRGDPQRGKFPGETLDDDRYRRWLVDLQSAGFEIGWHGATWHGSVRRQIADALERFAEVFGHYPKTASNHSDEEAVYWGYYRLGGWRSLLYRLATLHRRAARSRGHVAGDECFWGDLCKEKIKYFRNFVFQDVDTLKTCPFMPYHDPLRPCVNYWYASSDGNRIKRFNRCISEAAQDRLEEQGGACIMYTHFACGFVENGRLEPRFKALMERLAKKNGWFVPVGTLLDHLLPTGGSRAIATAERRRLEGKWLLEKTFTGMT
jgi:hypothetical protein